VAFKDNRPFIEALERTGDLVRMRREVDWDMEAGAIVRRLNEMQGPAVLFERIKDYPEGYRIFGAPVATFRRLSVALGLPPDTPVRELTHEFARRLESPIKPIFIRQQDAPCKENVLLGEEADLYRLPAPLVHDGDGGRYLASWHAVITKDPDSAWVNWGMYRAMIHNYQTLGGLCLPGSDQWKIMQKYWARGQAMPFAMAIGIDPLSALTAMMPVGVNVSEVDSAGALLQEPVELVKAETCDLPVPAHAEIIIEGEVPPGVFVDEGPFGEFTGYRSSPRAPRIIYQVKCITFRNDPIVTLTNMGVPVDDSDAGSTLCWYSWYKRLLTDAGVPVVDIYVPPEGVSHLVVISVKPLHSNIAGLIGNILGVRATTPPSHIIIVDDEVDPYDMTQVMHALVTKCHPVRGVIVRDRIPASPLTPFLSPGERRWGEGARVIFDCTWPLSWSREGDIPLRMSFENIYPQEIKEQVLKHWGSDGLPTL